MKIKILNIWESQGYIEEVYEEWLKENTNIKVIDADISTVIAPSDEDIYSTLLIKYEEETNNGK